MNGLRNMPKVGLGWWMPTFPADGLVSVSRSYWKLLEGRSNEKARCLLVFGGFEGEDHADP